MSDKVCDKIVVAVDGSEPSLGGVRMAIRLARAAALRIELVTVEPPVLLPPVVYERAIELVEEAQRDHAARVLKDASRVVEAAGLTCETTQLTGAPAEAIADYANTPDTWGVLIGARGHNALSRVLLGTVVDRLVHICVKPVLVVR